MNTLLRQFVTLVYAPLNASVLSDDDFFGFAVQGGAVLRRPQVSSNPWGETPALKPRIPRIPTFSSYSRRRWTREFDPKAFLDCCAMRFAYEHHAELIAWSSPEDKD